MAQITPYPIRIPSELRNALQESADTAGRSLQQEILLRLQNSIESAGSEPSSEQADLANEMQDLRRRVEALERIIADLRRDRD